MYRLTDENHVSSQSQDSITEMIREMGSISGREMASVKARVAQVELKATEASAAAAAAAKAAEEKCGRVEKEAAVEVEAAREAARTDAARVGSGVDALRMHVISVKRRTDEGDEGSMKRSNILKTKQTNKKKQTNKQINKQANRQTYKKQITSQTNKQITNKHTNKQINKQTDRLTKKINTQTNKHKNR